MSRRKYKIDIEGLHRSRWPDRSDLWSDHLWAHTCSRCVRITWSGEDFERTFVWTMVWILSDQRLRRSGTVWPEALLSANLSDQRPIREHTSLIRGRFVRTLVWSEADWSKFLFSIFFVLLTEAVSPKSLQYRRFLIRDPSRAWWFDQKQEAQLIATAGPRLKNLALTVHQDIIM